MSKAKQGNILLIPGEFGWELWSADSTSTLLQKTEHTTALDVPSLPANKDLYMAFPVRDLTALSLWGPQDSELGTELVELQVERMGLHQPAEMGQLHDFVQIPTVKSGDEVLYLIDVLSAPEEGKLPSKSPEAFVVSPRCFSYAESAIVFWQEFGRWVVAVTNDSGELIHYQCLTAKNRGQDMVQESRLLVAHLMMNGLFVASPKKAIIWSDDGLTQPAGLDGIEDLMDIQLVLEKKPHPVLPEQFSTLLPADTRAERVAKKQMIQRNILALASVLIVLGVLGFALFRLWALSNEASTAEAEAKELTESNQALLDHVSKWDELGPLADSKNNPIELLLNCSKAIPSKSLRLERVEFTHQFATNDEGIVLSINIQGEADKLEHVNGFDSRLKNNKELMHLSWNNPAANQTKTGWGFLYRAEPK